MNQIKILLGFGRNNIEEKLIKNVDNQSASRLTKYAICIKINLC